MFNDKSTHIERQEALQTVMRRGVMEGGELVHTPPQLNRLLARSPEEFNIFQQVGPGQKPSLLQYHPALSPACFLTNAAGAPKVWGKKLIALILVHAVGPCSCMQAVVLYISYVHELLLMSLTQFDHKLLVPMRWCHAQALIRFLSTAPAGCS